MYVEFLERSEVRETLGVLWDRGQVHEDRVEVVPGQPERQGNSADVIGYPEEWVT